MIVRHMGRWLALAALALAAAAVATGCGDDASGGEGPRLTLVAYSTPREVYEEAIPAFQATEPGAGVEFEQSYGASGDQRRAVEGGLPADIVALSLEPDVTALVDKGLVAADWQAGPERGMVSRSVVVLVVRKGNPKGIRGWDDLLQDDLSVITPNPFTSGGAQWNTMAAYGAQLQKGRSREQAIAYLAALYRNVRVQPKSAREALQTFIAGEGDVLIAYENEAITAQRAGEELEYAVPDETILIENPAAVVSSSGGPEAAGAFLTFMRSQEGQRIFGEKGYRPVDDQVLAEFDYPVPPGLFTIDGDLGGWPAVRAEFFDPDEGVVARIFREGGIDPG